MGIRIKDKFSDLLFDWLSSSEPKTLGDLIDKSEEKSFAVLFFLLMITPALPLPTGGVTHIFEIIVMLLALELVAGRDAVWLPKRWLTKKLPLSSHTPALPRLIKMVKWVEKYSIPRLSKVQINKISIRIIGFVILLFTVFAFLAPPFSGPDTLPSLGVVFLSLALIFEDVLLTMIGVIVGSVGIGLLFILGKLAFQLL